MIILIIFLIAFCVAMTLFFLFLIINHGVFVKKISANKLYRISDKGSRNKERRELKRINSQLIKAAKEGENEMYWDYKISDNNKNILKSRGFIIEDRESKFDPYWITWKK